LVGKNGGKLCSSSKNTSEEEEEKKIENASVVYLRLLTIPFSLYM
jgi:hypothetical protein